MTHVIMFALQVANKCGFFQWDDKEYEYVIEVVMYGLSISSDKPTKKKDDNVGSSNGKVVVDVDYDSKRLEKLLIEYCSDQDSIDYDTC